MPTFVRKIASIERPNAGMQTISWQVNVHSYTWSPPTDVYETETSFVVRVEVAGMRESEFSICIDDDYLLISGMRKESLERHAYHQMEIRFGEFNTALELPSGVDVNNTEAEYEDGFLTVILPKAKSTDVKVEG